MRLVLPDVPKSPNKRRGEHWSRSSKYAKYWKDLVRSQIDNSHKPCRVKMRVNISQMRKRKLDKDNLYGSSKPCLDALVAWKLLRDDSEKWCELTVTQTIGPEKITVVEIERV